MRWAGIPFLVVLLLATGCCDTGVRATKDFALTTPWEAYERIEVDLQNGGIELRLADVDAIEITGTKYVRGPTLAEAQQNVEQIEVLARALPAQPGTFRIELRYPKSLQRKSAGADLLICVPQPCAAHLETHNGAIRAADLRGQVVLATSNGSIHVTNIEGPVQADTSNGRIEAEDIRGGLRAETSNGRIVVRRIDGSCTLDTSNGAIRAEVNPPVDGHVIVHSSNGAVHLVLPADLGADVELSTGNGRVRTYFKEGVVRHSSHSTSPRGWTRSGEFGATLGDGDCRVEASTSNGSITLDMR